MLGALVRLDVGETPARPTVNAYVIDAESAQRPKTRWNRASWRYVTHSPAVLIDPEPVQVVAIEIDEQEG